MKVIETVKPVVRPNITIEFTPEEQDVLYTVVGRIGGGVNYKTGGNVPARMFLSEVYEALQKNMASTIVGVQGKWEWPDVGSPENEFIKTLRKDDC